MLLSLGGASTSDVDYPIVDFARASAQVSVSTAESEPPTSVTFSLLPPIMDSAAVASPRQFAENGAVGVTIVARPAIFLTDQDGNLVTSLDAPDSTGDDLYFGSIPEGWAGAPSGDPSIFDEQAKELTPTGLAALPTVPWTPDATIQGTLTSDRGWMTFTVPVGPSTNILRMAVHSGREGDVAAAMVDQMYLINSNGKLVACVTGVASLSPGTHQTLIISLQSPPAGGVLVVRMVQPPLESAVVPVDPTDSSDGLGALPPSTFNTPSDFTVEVYRDDTPVSPPSSTVVSPVPFILPASYAPAPSWSSGGHIGVLPTGASGPSANTADSGYAVNTASRTEKASAAADPIEDDAESPSISLGPLVSRGSSPMGPALATRVDDPAPSISRDDRAGLDRTFGRLDGADLEAALVARRDGAEAPRVAAGDGEAGEGDALPLTALKGLGGLPLMVASVRRRRLQERADELAATLRENADQAAELAALAEGPALAPAEQTEREGEIARAGLATRAVGFVIALGLASGPLYPDLVALARRKLARKRKRGLPLVRRFFQRRPPLPLA
jgi:hypothetical protein